MLCVCAVGLAAAEPSDSREFFELRIRPVLAKNCYGCHTATRMGGLQLDTREHALAGGKSGPAIVPGDPPHSLLFQAVSHTHERLKMPPGGKLKEQEIADLAAWIKGGATWPDGAPKAAPYVITEEQRNFWAFRPVRNPEPPRVRNEAWVKSPVDRFILAGLEEKGLSPPQRRTGAP